MNVIDSVRIINASLKEGSLIVKKIGKSGSVCTEIKVPKLPDRTFKVYVFGRIQVIYLSKCIVDNIKGMYVNLDAEDEVEFFTAEGKTLIVLSGLDAYFPYIEN